MAVETPVDPGAGPSEHPPAEGSPVSPEPSAIAVGQDLTRALKEKEEALAKLLEEQKKKGEISAASESTMQALMEQIKIINENMKVLNDVKAMQNLMPLRQTKKWWEDLLPW